ncbi:cytosine-purine permease [Trichoderma arundinaceum]|uniref:Cytosine-purine permease n=1 Tax=Trichoderma arundinaceum TaxID=490622 RepID=A0A395NCX6_TRIAR|nr:cytosine-purine permease [Trichoderma arundinaceum]
MLVDTVEASAVPVREKDGQQSDEESLLHKVLRAGRVEERGILPVPVEERSSTRFFNIFTVWFSINANILGMTGFTVIICITGGQCLSAISNGSVNSNAGIIIIAVLSLLVSFCGFRVLHIYETYAFIPAIISVVIATGCAGSGLKKQATPEEPATAANILNFGMIVASYQLPWAALASDFTTYFDPKVSSWRVFSYTYWGLLIPTVLLMVLGAAVAGAIPNNPEWQDAFDKYSVGGVLAAMLSSAGNFGKFIVVVLSLTLLGNTCGTFYAITLNFQTLAPWLFKVPRYLFSVIITGVIIAVAITAVGDFFESLENFVSIIGYWSAAFVGIVMVEHVVFRRQDYSSYDHAIWSDAKRLPLGIAALLSGVLCFGMVVPCMDQVWWQGPIAKTTGDIGFEMAFVVQSKPPGSGYLGHGVTCVSYRLGLPRINQATLVMRKQSSGPNGQYTARDSRAGTCEEGLQRSRLFELSVEESPTLPHLDARLGIGELASQ